MNVEIDKILIAMAPYREGFGVGSGILAVRKNPYQRGTTSRAVWEAGESKGRELRKLIEGE